MLCYKNYTGSCNCLPQTKISWLELSQQPSLILTGTWQRHTQYVWLHSIICVLSLINYWANPPLLDYRDVVWSPSSVQCSRIFEHILSFQVFIDSNYTKFSCHTLAEHRFHAVIVDFSSAFTISIWQYTTIVTSHIGRNSRSAICA